jgi:glucose/mannose transport system substrate-binding protein
MKSSALARVAMVAWAAAAASAGCSESSNEGRTVEVINWWSKPGEIDAMNQLTALFHAKYPTQKLENHRIPEPGMAREAIRDLLISGFPPETFQANGGWDLLTWVAYNNNPDSADTKLAELDAYAEWAAAVPDLVMKTVRFDGKIYAVPLNIHRVNMLFFNRRVFDDHGVEAPKWNDALTFDDLFLLCDRLKTAGVQRPIALATAQSWPLVLYLFENILVARAGAQGYLQFFSGDPGFDILNSVALQAALTDLSRLLAYDPEARTNKWDDAVEEMINGNAAMTIMGDWAKGYIDGKGGDVDFGAIPTPGTAGAFVFTTDTFSLPLGARNREGALKLLELAGSQQGQDEFNVKKGSIPARADATLLLFDEISQQNISDFYKVAKDPTKLVPATSILAPGDYTDPLNLLVADYAGTGASAERAGNVSVVLYGLKNRSDVLRDSHRNWSYSD